MADNYIISPVPLPLVEVLWPMCVKHVQRVVARVPDEITVESVKKKILSGDSMLITVSKGSEIVAINTLEVHTFDTGHKVMFIHLVGGDDWDDWGSRFLALAKVIAKDYGCTELRGMSVRPGWVRKLSKQGWETLHTNIKCKIEE